MPDSPQTSEPHPSTPERPNPLSEEIEYMAKGIPQGLGERLQAALDRVLGSRPDLTLYAGVNPIAVRAAEPSDVVAARLELPEAVPDLLGGKVETRALADGERLRVWLAGANRIEPGSTVALIAITSGGEIAETTVVAGASQGSIELTLPWDAARMPEAVALVFEQLR